MNREIKFRVWDNTYMDYDIWVNSYGAYGEPDDKHNTPYTEIKGYSDKSIIMQFTGLKDRNGKAIYEGDILETEDRIVKVIWHEYAGQWDTLFIRYKGEKQSNGLDNLEWKYKAKVIGNIYETPQLTHQ